jgi:HD-GYP domain-containing protein (c-di-GMP phosphodiesterase class II)
MMASPDDLDTHGERTAWLAAQLCQHMQLGPSTTELIARAARTHDVGKRFIPRSLLDKPSQLTARERTQMKQHCALGAWTLAKRDGCGTAEPTPEVLVALLHHEWWNGDGYPFGLAGHRIPLAARIVAVADTFDALVSERPYKLPWPQQAALDHIRDLRGRQFDPQCVDALLSLASCGSTPLVPQAAQQVRREGNLPFPVLAAA